MSESSRPKRYRTKKDPECNSITGGFIKSEPGKPTDVQQTHVTQMKRPNEVERMEAEARLNDKESPLEPFKPSWPKRKLGKRGKLATLGLSKDLVALAPPRLMAAIGNADKFRKVRSREYAISHGYVSAGVSSLMGTSALALAASRYLFDEFARTGDMDLLTLASKLSTDARVNELAAWELCAREAVARKKSQSSNVAMPWLEQPEEKRGRGRPRKVVVAKELQPAAGVSEAASPNVTENALPEEPLDLEPVDDSFPFSQSEEKG